MRPKVTESPTEGAGMQGSSGATTPMICACEHQARCNPASQRVALQLHVAPRECILFNGHLVHTNPTSRSDCDPGF